MEELVLVDLLGHGVVADEDDLDVLVAAGEEQVQQHEEALAHGLALLVHRAGDVHHAEHHRLRGRARHLDAVVVAQVEAVDEGDALDLGAQPGELLAQRAYFVAVLAEAGDGVVEFLLQRADARRVGRAERQPTAERAAHRADDVDVGRRAVGLEAGALGLVVGDLGELGADHARQLEVLEEQVEEFLARELEHEVVLVLALVARLALAAAVTAAAERALDAVAGAELVVTGKDLFPDPALAVMQRRFGEVARGDGDLLAVVQVADRAAVDGLGHRLADLLLEAAHEALAVDRALVLAVEAPIDDADHVSSLWHAGSRAGRAILPRPAGGVTTTCARAGTTRTAGAPASRCNPCRSCGRRRPGASSARRRWPWR